MSAPPTEVFSAFAFAGFLLCMIPLPWHLEAWNTGTCLFMLWTGLGCLNQFINSIVWNGNAINWAPVWCDISSRFIVGQAVAIPAAALCINRRLYHISSANTVTVTKSEKRRAILVDLAIGLGIPFLEMILQYISQGHRFNIYEDIGCYPFTYTTPVSMVLVDVWPVTIGCVSAVYCIMSIRAFNKRRSQFKELLSSNNNLTANRYLRLMCLAGIDVALTVPLSTYALTLNALHGISPWVSWEDTHEDFSRVDLYPAVIWRSFPHVETSLELSRWFLPLCALVFFAFFGFADEARKHYRLAINSVAKRIGYSTRTMKSGAFSSDAMRSGPNFSSSGRTGTLPVYVTKHTSRKRDTFDSVTDMSLSFNGNPSLKEKSFNGNVSFDALSLNDVGGTLPDLKQYPPSPSSSSSPSLNSPPALRSPSHLSPNVPYDDYDEHMIEISSVRMSVASIRPPAVPQPVLNTSHVRRHSADAPLPARPTDDIV